MLDNIFKFSFHHWLSMKDCRDHRCKGDCRDHRSIEYHRDHRNNHRSMGILEITGAMWDCTDHRRDITGAMWEFRDTEALKII